MRSVVGSWSADGALYEKYSCEEDGQAGGGGEYQVQTGFGWTNGVTLSFLARYPDITSSSTSLATSLLTTTLSLVMTRL